jgi:CubicO group peptidase (beta-lactamase class C family)
VDYGRGRLRDFLAGYALPRDPGAAYEYSNLGFGLLGQALAGHAHEDYGRLLQHRILEPLAMRSTGTVLTPALRRRLVPGHDEAGAVAAHWTFGALAGAGALLSDGNDMLRWLQANMGTAGTPLAAAMRMAHLPRRGIGGGDLIGLAWMTSVRAGDAVTWHNGITGGYASFIGFTADGRRGVVILASAARMPQELGFAALVPALPVPPLPRQPAARAAADAIVLAPALLAQYVGRYQLAPGVEIGIRVESGRLRAQLLGEATYPLYATARDRFSYATIDAHLDFERDATGKVVALVLHQPGSDQRAPRVR